MKKLEERPEWDDIVKNRNRYSLRELSEMYGAAPAAISNALKRNGYKRNHAPPGPRDKRNPNWHGKGSTPAAAKKTAPKPPASAKGSTKKGDDNPFKDEKPIEGTPLRGYAHLAGKGIDRHVAEVAKVSVSAVTNYRRRHGIPAYMGRGPIATTTRGEQGSKFNLSGKGGWLATFEGHPAVVVIANDVEAAFQAAKASGKGNVTGMNFLGSEITLVA